MLTKPQPGSHRWPALALSVTAWLTLATACCAQDDLATLEQQAVRAAVARVAPSVVRIETVGGLERVERVLVGAGVSTGLVVAADGYVISSAFNFIQKPSAILVTLPGGKRAPAQIVARDHSRMLVLLKVAVDAPLAVPEAVPRDQMAVGQWTIALGRAFDQDAPNVSVGILSATSRIWGRAIQTDAKISPDNYGGPLIDIRGRVLGVLVPLSPQQQDEVAGAEWYDSGIGFAVPLADLLPHLDQLKRGEELYPGLLGVAFKGSDIYADRPEIAACLPKSPARQAGLEAGDLIVEVEGVAIVRQSQLRHALGPRYAGDQIRLAILRDGGRLELSAQLADKLEPYENPFLGLLPDRSPTAAPGVAVRYVYPDSPADKAGVSVGDRLIRLADKTVTDLASAWEVLGNYEPQQVIRAAVQRGAQTRQLELKLTSLPDMIPDKLPPAQRAALGQGDTPGQAAAAAAGERPPVGDIRLKLPEEPNECWAYVPETYRADIAYGVVLWLDEPGAVERREWIAPWKGLCDANDLILVVPRAADPNRWLPAETAVVRKLLDDVLARYHVDRARIVAGGYGAGGALAALTAFSHRSLVRGLVIVDTALPGRLQAPANDPIERLSVLASIAEKSEAAERLTDQAAGLRQMKYPVIIRPRMGEPRPLDEAERAELVRWIDTLDRL